MEVWAVHVGTVPLAVLAGSSWLFVRQAKKILEILSPETLSDFWELRKRQNFKIYFHVCLLLFRRTHVRVGTDQRIKSIAKTLPK